MTPSTAADNSIDGLKVIDNSVLNVKLKDATIPNQKIADGTIITSKLADGSITDAKIVTMDFIKLRNIPRLVFEDLPYFDKSLLWIDPADSNNYLKRIPNEWCQILKQQCRLCQICKNSNRNAQYMKEHHQIEIPLTRRYGKQ